MSNAPLMPKATAVWLVENTSLTFDQIANFCKLHPLEVKGIADGDVAAGIRGHDPITSGQLTREAKPTPITRSRCLSQRLLSQRSRNHVGLAIRPCPGVRIGQMRSFG